MSSRAERGGGGVPQERLMCQRIGEGAKLLLCVWGVFWEDGGREELVRVFMWG